jgi:putative ABC transport system permease protein
MFKNYFKIAIRSLSRQMMYSFINLIGLAVSMACSLVIFLYVYGEWSHDRHFAKADRIYRIGVSFFNMGNFANGPERLRNFLPKEFAGMEAFTQFQQSRETFRSGDDTYKDEVFYVDSSFFSVFAYSFVEGDPQTALQRPYSVVLSESMAKKYFQHVSALGKTLEVGKKKELHTVTGIVKDDDRPSHIKAKIWMFRQPDESGSQPWTSASVFTYLLLKEGVSEINLNQALGRIIEKDVYPQSVALGQNISLKQYLDDPNSVKFLIQPLKDVYLKSKLNSELSPGGNLTNLYIFSVIAIFILVLAAVNFVNLSTARATRRAKEVGIRKSLGTSRKNLILQFLLESVLMCLTAMVVALGLAELFTFVFFWINGQQLVIHLWNNFSGVLGLILFTVLVGIVAGIYPAFYLTSFNPVNVLKGNLGSSGSSALRNGLVVFQFTISIALIIAITVIIRQLNFMSDKDLGFTSENVITIDGLTRLNGSEVAYKEELLQHSDVLNASLHAGEPGSKAVLSFSLYKTAEMENAMNINTYFGDPAYLDVMRFRLLQGRNFNRDLASDTASVILNEAAVRELNLTDPIGAVLNKNMTVIGVVSDFHWESLRNAIAPTAIVLPRFSIYDVGYHQLALKIKSASASSVLKTAEARWKQLAPDESFKYHFMDENFGLLVKKEEVLAKAIGFFTVLAIVISCLGLFGLSAYTTEQRTKEIGIRKVLGASVSNIVLLLTKQFTKLVVVSLVVAIPLSYYAAEQWLSGFAYRTTLSLWIFAAGGLLGLCISCITVAFHSIKASQTNPSETLKCE